MNKLLTFLRLFVVVFYVSSMWYDITQIRFKFDKDLEAMNLFMSGRWMYLTHWNMVLMTFYFFVAFVNDLVGSNEVSSKQMPFIRRFKDSLFTSITFPLSMFAGSIFWILYAIDRELIFPRKLDGFVPGWFNHTMHTYIIILVLMEMFLSFRQYPSKKVGIKRLGTLCLIYIVWAHAIKFTLGFWVYPILEVLDVPAKILFYVGLLLFASFFYILGDFINGIVWKQELQELSVKNKSKKKF